MMREFYGLSFMPADPDDVIASDFEEDWEIHYPHYNNDPDYEEMMSRRAWPI